MPQNCSTSAAPDALVSIIVPVYNESGLPAVFSSRITKIFRELTLVKLEMIFVNDGSTDATLDELLRLKMENPSIKIIDLSRNFGKEAAITAGLDASQGDVAIPIDIDLQDPPELIIEMLKKWREGYEVVLGVRADRYSDKFWKRTLATSFYRFHNRISPLKIPENAGDFRLMDRKVVAALRLLPENQRYMKGLFAWVGFRTCAVEYTRQAREAGVSKFKFLDLCDLALNALSGFSTLPLRMFTFVGIAFSVLASIFALIIIIQALLVGIDVPGYASIIVAILLMGGINLIGIGILGEYLARGYIESKRRPIYVIRSTY